jgi:hypothetical protein
VTIRRVVAFSIPSQITAVVVALNEINGQVGEGRFVKARLEKGGMSDSCDPSLRREGRQ